MSARPGTVTARVAAFTREHGLLAGVRRLRVGFSGGADSTALLVLLRELHPDLEAVHLHHGLRGADADADAAWCDAFCATRGIPCVAARLEVPRARRAGESTEEAARRLRLEYWAATTPAADTVALGHHLDDGLEDLLLRLTRGANASGLTALRPLTELCGVRIVRPLLCLRRREVEAFLADVGIADWRRDASNADPVHRRNAVRHQWLPLLRQTVGHDLGLVRSLEALRDDADCLTELALGHLGAVRDPEALRQLHPALLPRVLRAWLHQETGHDQIVPRQAVLRLRHELERPLERPRRVPLGQGACAELGPEGLRLLHERAAVASRPWPWRLWPELSLPEIQAVLSARPVTPEDNPRAPADRLTEHFAPAALADTLEVRSWQPGDRLVPFGRRRPVKLQDLFSKAHVPRERRSGIPVVLCRGTVIWLPGVRRAEFGRVPPGSAAVCLRLRPAEA